MECEKGKSVEESTVSVEKSTVTMVELTSVGNLSSPPMSSKPTIWSVTEPLITQVMVGNINT